MNIDFLKAIEFVFEHEGYKAEDPHDPGGLTIWGLASRYHPEVKQWVNLSKEEAREKAKVIYYKEYWSKAGKGLKWPLCIIVFDTAVQFSPRDAVILLQKILNSIDTTGTPPLKIDGVLGHKTQEKAAEAMLQTPDKLCYKYLMERIRLYTRSHNFKYYGKGWIKRVLDLEKILC